MTQQLENGTSTPHPFPSYWSLTKWKCLPSQRQHGTGMVEDFKVLCNPACSEAILPVRHLYCSSPHSSDSEVKSLQYNNPSISVNASSCPRTVLDYITILNLLWEWLLLVWLYWGLISIAVAKLLFSGVYKPGVKFPSDGNILWKNPFVQ